MISKKKLTIKQKRIIDIKENGQLIDREITYNEYLGVE